MSMMLEALAGTLLIVGALFALIGAVGLLRFPDALSRMHAASKAGALGSGFCLVAVAVHETAFDVTTRAIAAVLFFLLTAPVSAHLIARATLLAGYSVRLNYDAMSAKNRQKPANDRLSGEDKASG